MQEIITLDYGSGGLKTAQLIDQILVPSFANTALCQLGDGAVLPPLEGPPVFSTDSFVVTPWRFPGGDIGKLAVCGTVNDLCMAGGVPRYLSFSLILEEGFALDDLRAVVASAAEAARQAGRGAWTMFVRITLPLMTPAIFYVLVVSLINAFQLFPQIMIMTDGGPNGATQVMVERIYKCGFRYYRMGYAAAFSWLLFVIIMACTGLQMKVQERWVNYDS